jgi:hypothetical protein
MNVKHIGFMGLLLAAGVMISLTFGGAWLGSTDIAIANTFTVWKQVNILGIWSINAPNIDFFIGGAKALIMMDFAFFIGPLAIVQWFLFFILGVMLFWGFFTVAIGLFSGIFRH